MRTPTKQHTRAERLREHAALVEQARRVVDAMAGVVRARETRPNTGDLPLEIAFARTDVDGRALPAAVWVALRRDDADAAVDAMTAESTAQFLVEEREEMGAGYRLQAVQETLPIPETDLLITQLAGVLSMPPDVLKLVAEWGRDDPRASCEIDALLTARFGPAPLQPPAPADPSDEPVPDIDADGNLTMSVKDVAEVLRLDEAQVRALTVLVSNATVKLTRNRPSDH